MKLSGCRTCGGSLLSLSTSDPALRFVFRIDARWEDEDVYEGVGL